MEIDLALHIPDATKFHTGQIDATSRDKIENRDRKPDQLGNMNNLQLNSIDFVW